MSTRLKASCDVIIFGIFLGPFSGMDEGVTASAKGSFRWGESLESLIPRQDSPESLERKRGIAALSKLRNFPNRNPAPGGSSKSQF